MRPLINLICRAALRIIYPLATIYWKLFDRNVQGTYVMVWWNDRLLVIRNSYRQALNVPGGMVKRDEDPALTAARELFEEAGITVDSTTLTYLGEAPKKDPKGFGIAHMFETVLPEEPELNIDNREVIWAGFMSPEDALQEQIEYAVEKYLKGEVGGRPAGAE